MGDKVADRFRVSGEPWLTAAFSQVRVYLMDTGLGLHLFKKPRLDVLPVGILSRPGERLHQPSLFMELHIHLVGRPLQPQDGDIPPLFEENAVDETIPEKSEPQQKEG